MIHVGKLIILSIFKTKGLYFIYVMNEKSLKTLKYGDPTKEHIEKMNRETDLFSISFRDIRYPAPQIGRAHV